MRVNTASEVAYIMYGYSLAGLSTDYRYFYNKHSLLQL